METKRETLSKLRRSAQIYSLVSACTQMPYVVCDPETYDDEVLLFYKEKDARAEAERLLKSGQPVVVSNIENKFLLAFYTGLFPMGVNCLRVDKGLGSETTVQLSELVQRKKPGTLEENTVIVENPEFTLTALYFLQGIRRKDRTEITEELKELYKEVIVDFKKGTFVVPVLEDNRIPTVSQKDGKVYQPVFTDIQEFFKFQAIKAGKVKLRPAPMKAEEIVKMLSEEMEGVVVDPAGMNLQLHLKRKNDR